MPSTDLVLRSSHSKNRTWARKQLDKHLRTGEHQFWCWVMAQTTTYRDMVPLFIERWNEPISIGMISKHVNAEIEHQRQLKDRSAHVLREAATTTLEKVQAEQWSTYYAAREKGALKVANEALMGIASNAMNIAKLHGAVAPNVTKIEASGEIEHSFSSGGKVAALLEHEDDYEKQLQAELVAAMNPQTT